MTRRILIAVVVLLFAAPLFAFNRGDVLLENRVDLLLMSPPQSTYALWLHFGWRYAVAAGAVPLIYKMVPYAGEGHFLVPASNQYVFHHEQTVSMWDGRYRSVSSPEPAYNEIFRDTTELGEIAPMRNGHFLVTERWNEASAGAKVIEFDAHGRIAEYAFPTVLDPATGRALGATHIELLADQCTLLYTRGSDALTMNHVGRLNLCTRQAESDFATLLEGQYAGSIRQLPSGDVLVANGSAVLQFTSEGALLRSDPLTNVTHLALTADGQSFWTAGVSGREAILRQIDQPPVPLGNPQMQSFTFPVETTDLVVVGEWRASAPVAKPRTRAARH